MGQVYAPDPLINVTIGAGSTTSGCGGSQPPIYSQCPAAPGNGLANNLPGANPMQAVALAYIPAFKAVAMGAGGVTLADNGNPAHRDVVLGLSDNNYAAGATVSIYHNGPITNPIPGIGGWNWVVNKAVYLQANGDLAQTIPPSGFVQKLGFALSSNTMMIRLGDADAAPVPVAYPYAATINVSLQEAQIADITLTGGATINFLGGEDGDEVVLRVTQDGTGNHAITWGAMCDFPGGTPPAHTLTANKTDLFTFQYNAALSKYVLTNASLNLG